ncbi:hypothetical protein [Pedobacter montanisoli]|uniref:GLPGLI family protein n=1 Tax=Pedobacter montanisoli TaxID=2923277 RepID=A0ABS9ZUX0_9SPHI|nr:hypothetical protein [Pedobacter montanisoli]MCJ0741368.1 hypothetical protein [Pedobacter montanisoli]
MNKKIFFLLVNICLMVTLSNAQITYERGYAILKDGTRINGLISRFDQDPWFNQRYILFKDSAEFASNPESKATKYKADDLQFYQLGNTSYDKIHFVDTENLQLKSLGTNDHMMERLSTGRINAHKFYSYPIDVEVFIGTAQELAEWISKNKSESLSGYKILITKDKDGKPKNAFNIDMLKYFEDTPEVSQKFKTGAYGNEPVGEKKGLAAKMISMAKKATFKPREAEAIVTAINDYNQRNP